MSAQAHTPSRSSFPVVVAIVGSFLLFWFLTSEVYVDEPEAAAPAALDIPTLAEHQGKAESALESYSVTDAANGKVRLSIERAKELVIAEKAK
ncbi:hypothetical protein [Pelagicoccus sp. SDUM812003]|uniref:hypothetical protein n=1 Tax=Pelagicoccus sp. SDUM812003 TaxID=3041267 RepID=UPI00280D0253|nr:hypothetical protein [Pelagicoccus sp. SDUM812003]MDQ8202979.1 hypothetical protein [Pelagicoccus sp. SDUM812003]